MDTKQREELAVEDDDREKFGTTVRRRPERRIYGSPEDSPAGAGPRGF
jgi:hypothetical protein